MAGFKSFVADTWLLSGLMRFDRSPRSRDDVAGTWVSETKLAMFVVAILLWLELLSRDQ